MPNFTMQLLEWRRAVALVPIGMRGVAFCRAAVAIAALVGDGLDRGEAAEALTEIAIAHDLDALWSESVILTELEKPQARKPNGKDHGPPLLQATPYIPPEGADIPRRQWIYGQHYMRGIVTATVAPGGFGKTTLSLFEAVTMVVGGHRIWYLSGEDDRTEIDRRIAAHTKTHAIKPFDLGNRLFIDDRVSFPLKIAKTVRDGVLFDDATLAMFENTIEQNMIEVVILDPLVSFHSLSENDTAAMDALVKRLGVIAMRRQCCIELSHHVRKPSFNQSEITVYDARGALAIVNAARSVRVLNQMPKSVAEAANIDATTRNQYIRIDSGKRNMAPAEAARWSKLVNVEIDNGDHVQALEAWVFPTTITTEEDRTWLRVTLTDKAYRADPQSPTWLGRRVAERQGRSLDTKADTSAVQRQLTRWEREGLIRKTKLPDEHRKPRDHWVLCDNNKPPSEAAASEADQAMLFPEEDDEE